MPPVAGRVSVSRPTAVVAPVPLITGDGRGPLINPLCLIALPANSVRCAIQYPIGTPR